MSYSWSHDVMHDDFDLVLLVAALDQSPVGVKFSASQYTGSMSTQHHILIFCGNPGIESQQQFEFLDVMTTLHLLTADNISSLSADK